MKNHPNQMEKYACLWSEVRLVIAALALFIGGIPPAVKFGILAPGSAILTLAWIVSGLAAVLLAYEYFVHRKVFNTKKPHDMLAFLILVISGINLGLVPILGRNIGMSIIY